MQLVGSYFPDQGLNLQPLHWKHKSVNHWTPIASTLKHPGGQGERLGSILPSEALPLHPDYSSEIMKQEWKDSIMERFEIKMLVQILALAVH